MKIKMWGEILEPPVKAKEKKEKPRSVSHESDEEQQDLKPTDVFTVSPPRSSSSANTGHQLHHENLCVKAMLEVIAQSGHHVKSQQIGEAELTLDQRRVELLQQYKNRPLVFLEKYHSCLKPEHLAAFAHVSSDPRTLHYSKVIERRDAGFTNKTRVKNHRYAALRSLQKSGYFSDEQMRIREPLLYEQYIGQYLTDEEVLERSQEAMQEGASEGSGGLAHLLLNSYQERLIQKQLQEEQEREDGAQEEDEDEEENDIHGQEKEWEPTTLEKAQLREEFVSQMHQRFLDGKDEDFDYSEVDENPDYDNLDIVSRDAEEKYFDEDDDNDEDEDDENMIE
ncbi:coiled-coil domain-containing protein 97 isoform X2 [Eucyclogobius newberryi]|uniref:coiled-coil domain-containing protein 97 isoform X2 n=1 Tax=Eucyclogobius newberryi TaxID=166745 RepID=UPI003B5A9CC0